MFDPRGTFLVLEKCASRLAVEPLPGTDTASSHLKMDGVGRLTLVSFLASVVFVVSFRDVSPNFLQIVRKPAGFVSSRMLVFFGEATSLDPGRNKSSRRGYWDPEKTTA